MDLKLWNHLIQVVRNCEHRWQNACVLQSLQPQVTKTLIPLSLSPPPGPCLRCAARSSWWLWKPSLRIATAESSCSPAGSQLSQSLPLVFRLRMLSIVNFKEAAGRHGTSTLFIFSKALVLSCLLPRLCSPLGLNWDVNLTTNVSMLHAP